MMNGNTTKVRQNGVPTNTTPTPRQAPSRAQRITREARLWTSFVLERTGMNPGKVAEKALDAVAFSIDAGAKALAVPTKLAGVKEHQAAIATVAEMHPIYAQIGRAHV